MTDRRIHDQEQPAALEAVNLSKRYWRGTRALSDVSLRIVTGSLTALVGPNAAGKSTLIRSWVGFARPTGGGVRVAGIDPWRHRATALARLGYIPQQPALYRGLSVADHLDLAGHVRAGFDRAGAMRHLEDRDIPLRSRPGRLSGGQQAQVVLAIVLGTQADIFLLDEPIASLDPLARSEFLGLLRARVRERGATALLSSHNVSDVVAVCDRIVVLGVGRVLLDGSLPEVARQHAVAAGPTSGGPMAERVADFPDQVGEPLTLLRLRGDMHRSGPPPDLSMRPATIDEIVKGYLVAGRGPGRGNV